MSAPVAIPEERYLEPPDPAGFMVECLEPNRLIYFLLNVGDGDTQLILLPRIGGDRRALVVDVSGGQQDKLPTLVMSPEGRRPAAYTAGGGARHQDLPDRGRHPSA